MNYLLKLETKSKSSRLLQNAKAEVQIACETKTQKIS